MLDVFNFASSQTANYQEFYGGNTVRDWIKPRGASMVRMLLIGAGGGGANGGAYGGGASGAVTQWIGPAIFIPDILRVSIGAGGTGGAAATTVNNGVAGGATTIIYQQKDGTGYTLLTANGGDGGSAGVSAGGAGSSNNFFGASGIFKSVSGQDGSATASISASTTTFLSGGAPGPSALNTIGFSVSRSYGYPTVSGGSTGGGRGSNGYFITQPILLSAGGAGGGSGGSGTAGGAGGNAGIGSGGGGGAVASSANHGAGGRGGDGAVFIWSW